MSGDQTTSVLEAWRLVDINATRKKMDTQALEVAQHRDSSTKRRKELGQSTRAFKAFSPQEKLTGFGSLMKLYQDEVDCLTKRAKYCETAFTGLYKTISEAPDPVPHLEAAGRSRDELASLQAENRKLTGMVSEYEEETSGLRDQGAVIRQMKEQIRSLEDQDQVHSSRKGPASEEQEQEFNSRIEEASLREAELRKQLAVVTAELQQARQSHDSSQKRMFEEKSRQGGAQRARDDETDLLTAELNRTHEKVARLESEVVRLKAAPDCESASARKGATADVMLAAKDAELERVTKSLRELQTQHTETASRCITVESSTKAALASKNGDIEALQRKLQSLPSEAQFLHLQKQVRIFEALEGSGGSNGSGASPGGSSGEAGPAIDDNAIHAPCTCRHLDFE